MDLRSLEGLTTGVHFITYISLQKNWKLTFSSRSALKSCWVPCVTCSIEQWLAANAILHPVGWHTRATCVHRQVSMDLWQAFTFLVLSSVCAGKHLLYFSSSKSSKSNPHQPSLCRSSMDQNVFEKFDFFGLRYLASSVYLQFTKLPPWWHLLKLNLKLCCDISSIPTSLIIYVKSNVFVFFPL